jgi:hypothetical protein
MLAIDDYLALAVFAISLDDCDHLWGFRFSFFDRGRNDAGAIWCRG